MAWGAAGGRRLAVAVVLGAAALMIAACLASGVGTHTSLFSWDSYSTREIRDLASHAMFAHGVLQRRPAFVARRPQGPVSDSGEHPGSSAAASQRQHRADGSPIMHDTRSGRDAPVWDGTGLYRNWGVPIDGISVAKGCGVLPRSKCLPASMKHWHHGDPLPQKDEQFLEEENSKWKPPPAAEGKLTPGEKEAQAFFREYSRGPVKRFVGAMGTPAGSAADSVVAPTVGAQHEPTTMSQVTSGDTISMYGGHPFAVPTTQYSSIGRPAYQGWNYGQTPLSEPGLGRAAVVPMVGHTIPDYIMKAFERDNPQWKPVMKKLKCTTCAVALTVPRPVAVVKAPGRPSVGGFQVPVSINPAIAGLKKRVATARKAAVVGQPAATTGVWWGGGTLPEPNSALWGDEAPLPPGPGGVLVPGAGSRGINWGFHGDLRHYLGYANTLLPTPVESAALVSGESPTSTSTTVVTPQTFSGIRPSPTLRIDTWAAGHPHERRHAPPQGTTHVASAVSQVVPDFNSASWNGNRPDKADRAPTLDTLTRTEQRSTRTVAGFRMPSPNAAAQSGQHMAAGDTDAAKQLVASTTPNASLQLNTAQVRKANALVRLGTKAEQTSAFMFNAPAIGQQAENARRLEEAAPRGAEYDGIPIEQLQAKASPQVAIGSLQRLQEQQLAEQHARHVTQMGSHLGRRVIAALASLVERDLANNERGDVQKQQESGQSHKGEVDIIHDAEGKENVQARALISKAVKDEKDLGLTMLSVSDNLARAGWS